jgi:hypothetical protein
MFKPLRSILLVAILLGTLLPIAAQEDETTLMDVLDDFSGIMVNRPRSPLEVFELEIKTFRMDGIDGKYMELAGKSISLRGSVPNNWVHNPRLNANYSIAWENRYEPDAMLSFSIFAKRDFIKTDDMEGLLSYLAGLRRIHRNRLTVSNTSADAAKTNFSSYLLGKPSFLIEYEIKNDPRNPTARGYYTYLIPFDDFWMEIGIQAPTDKLSGYVPEFNRFLRNLSVQQEERR